MAAWACREDGEQRSRFSFLPAALRALLLPCAPFCRRGLCLPAAAAAAFCRACTPCAAPRLPRSRRALAAAPLHLPRARRLPAVPFHAGLPAAPRTARAARAPARSRRRAHVAGRRLLPVRAAPRVRCLLPFAPTCRPFARVRAACAVHHHPRPAGRPFLPRLRAAAAPRRLARALPRPFARFRISPAPPEPPAALCRAFCPGHRPPALCALHHLCTLQHFCTVVHGAASSYTYTIHQETISTFCICWYVLPVLLLYFSLPGIPPVFCTLCSTRMYMFSHAPENSSTAVPDCSSPRELPCMPFWSMYYGVV